MHKQAPLYVSRHEHTTWHEESLCSKQASSHVPAAQPSTSIRCGSSHKQLFPTRTCAGAATKMRATRSAHSGDTAMSGGQLYLTAMMRCGGQGEEDTWGV